MGQKRRLEAALIAALIAGAALAGCALRPAARPAPTGAAAPAEPMKERLANQARAIAELSAENQKLLDKIEALLKENAELKARLAPPAPGPGPAPAPGGKQ